MRLQKFLRWDDGTETHYELIGGFPMAMAHQPKRTECLLCAW